MDAEEQHRKLGWASHREEDIYDGRWWRARRAYLRDLALEEHRVEEEIDNEVITMADQQRKGIAIFHSKSP